MGRTWRLDGQALGKGRLTHVIHNRDRHVSFVALGLITSFTMGGMIHILLVVALVVVLIRVIQGRRALG